MAITVTLDVTGFYFSKAVTGDFTTVQDVMDAVVSKTAADRVGQPETAGPPLFQYETQHTSAGEFCSGILIRHFEPPKSRQVDQSGNPKPAILEKGIYYFNDSIPGQVANPQHAWQYYVIREDGKGVLASGDVNGKRVIVPFSDSAASNGGVSLEEKDRIIWRLVGICSGPTVTLSESSPSMAQSPIGPNQPLIPQLPLKAAARL